MQFCNIIIHHQFYHNFVFSCTKMDTIFANFLSFVTSHQEQMNMSPPWCLKELRAADAFVRLDSGSYRIKCSIMILFITFENSNNLNMLSYNWLAMYSISTSTTGQWSAIKNRWWVLLDLWRNQELKLVVQWDNKSQNTEYCCYESHNRQILIVSSCVSNQTDIGHHIQPTVSSLQTE